MWLMHLQKFVFVAFLEAKILAVWGEVVGAKWSH